MSKFWTPGELIRLYRIDKPKTSIYRDEANGVIPKAKRIKRGQSFFRMWEQSDLPKIGETYGFLSKPLTNKVIAVYTPKGGVLKTTLSLNLARCLALNGIKTLVIGLDVQSSITYNLLQESHINVESLDDIKSLNGIYETTKSIEDGGCQLEDTILGTDLPTLFFIPESTTLNHLEQRIRDERRREHFISRLIAPLKSKFDVIIFDNSPNWNFLIQNSLVAATDIISPVACDVETYRSLTQNIEMINDFKATMELDWNNFILVPTKLARNKISTQIEAQYRTLFPNLITTGSIREAVKGQESSLEQLSVIEYDSRSPLADDYYEIIQDIWRSINSDKPGISDKEKRDKTNAEA